jgi:DnaJ domain
MSTLYDVLGVAPDAEDDVIRQTFRELAKAFHPDAHGGEGPDEQRFKRMTAAYAVLKHAKTRAAYDAKLALGHRLARRQRIRGLVICVAGAIVSFSSVSALLLYRNASASAYTTNDVGARQTEIMQAWRSVVPDHTDASPAPSVSAPLNPQAGPATVVAQAQRQDLERQDFEREDLKRQELARPQSQPAGATTQAASRPSAQTAATPDPASTLVTGSIHQPNSTARYLALPGPNTTLPAPKLLTTDVRVWARSAEFGPNGSPRYVAKIFKVRRELGDRPAIFDRGDALRRPAEGENEFVAESCPSTVAAACAVATDRPAK